MLFKETLLLLFAIPASAFSPRATVHRNDVLRAETALRMGFDLSGNTWKPDSASMGSTDTGDYFPEGYSSNISYTDGMMGSQVLLNKNKGLPELPGKCDRRSWIIY
jgi:hypothetical protein